MIISGKLKKAIKDYILSDENHDEIIHELERYKKEFPAVEDYNWYEYGNILPYYSQIRDFYNKNGFYPDGSNAELEAHFKFHIKLAIDELLAEAGK